MLESSQLVGFNEGDLKFFRPEMWETLNSGNVFVIENSIKLLKIMILEGKINGAVHTWAKGTGYTNGTCPGRWHSTLLISLLFFVEKKTLASPWRRGLPKYPHVHLSGQTAIYPDPSSISTFNVPHGDSPSVWLLPRTRAPSPADPVPRYAPWSNGETQCSPSSTSLQKVLARSLARSLPPPPPLSLSAHIIFFDLFSSFTALSTGDESRLVLVLWVGLGKKYVTKTWMREIFLQSHILSTAGQRCSK